MTVEEKILKYMALGYTQRTDFPGEYTLLVNWKTLDMVRVYLDGRVWGKTGQEPNYILLES